MPPARPSIVVTGARSAGKTALIRRLAEGAFAAPAPTVGVDFGVLPLPGGARANVFDLAGGGAWADARADFFRDAAALVLVFDASAEASFGALEGALAEARRAGLPARARALVLAARPAAAPRAVPAERARAWAAARGADFFYGEVCARSGAGAPEALAALARAVAAAGEGEGGDERRPRAPPPP